MAYRSNCCNGNMQNKYLLDIHLEQLGRISFKTLLSNIQNELLLKLYGGTFFSCVNTHGSYNF